MPTIRLLILALLILFTPRIALAEGDCPPGFYRYSNPGHPGNCVPLPTMPEQTTGPRWRTTWGAIAAEPGSGKVGASVGKETEFDAKRAAKKACQVDGRDCKIVLTYNHQCAAIAEVPNTPEGASTKRGYAAGPDKMTSGQEATSVCEGANPGASCKIVYSECSAPVYVP